MTDEEIIKLSRQLFGYYLKEKNIEQGDISYVIAMDINDNNVATFTTCKKKLNKIINDKKKHDKHNYYTELWDS